MKILCPYHEDHVPSMEVYPDGYCHCFVCQKHVAVTELPDEVLFTMSGTVRIESRKEKYVENIAESIAAIEKLPVLKIRGLDLHSDGTSYYILWPDRSFYNRRFFEVAPGASKYKCPAGNAKRLLVCNPLWPKSSRLAIVEGELNALSISLLRIHNLDIVSPGSAGDFYSKTAEANLPHYLGYKEIYLFADEDKGGAIACIELKAKLLQKMANVNICLMKTDANDILVNYGKSALEEEIIAKMGM